MMFYQPDIAQGHRYLTPEDSKHAVRVLRLKPGDKIEVTDGKGGLYHTAITSADSAACQFDILQTSIQPHRPYNIHLAIAPTKSPDRIEWFVEKSTELGIDHITFIEC